MTSASIRANLMASTCGLTILTVPFAEHTEASGCCIIHPPTYLPAHPSHAQLWVMMSYHGGYGSAHLPREVRTAAARAVELHGVMAHVDVGTLGVAAPYATSSKTWCYVAKVGEAEVEWNVRALCMCAHFMKISLSRHVVTVVHETCWLCTGSCKLLSYSCQTNLALQG